MRARTLVVLAGLSLSAAACADTNQEAPEASEAELTSLTTLWSDAKRLDLGDLARLTAGFATDGLNGALAGNTLGARFERPAVFGEQAEPTHILPDSVQIHGLDAIVSGLAARFGEKELSTEVNAARLAHLRATTDDYFVESAFTLRAGAIPDWGFQAGGFDLHLGLEANAEVSSRVIVATPSDGLRSLASAPLAAVQQMRGFVFPRSVKDIRGMKPGEMFGLRGNGQLGANFGVGAPIFVAEPTGALSYRVVVSAGVATVVRGQLDVQLQRLPGDEVVVDLGVENGRGVSFNASVGDAWGVKGICQDGTRCLRPVQLGGAVVDLRPLVESAIEQQMNKYLTFQASASASLSGSRVSLSRFRVHLDRGNEPEVSRALEHLLRFDLRLAQALANRDVDLAAPAVTQDFDAVRAATTSTRNFGFEVLGMNIFHRAVVDREGTFVLQTPDGVRSILFDHVRKEGGWFRERHAFARTGIGAQVLDPNDPSGFHPAANLHMETLSSHGNMSDDFMIDNLDALILGVAGRSTLDALDRFGTALELSVERNCPEPEPGSQDRWSERCNVGLLDNPGMQDLLTRGLAAIEPTIEGLPETSKQLVREAAKVRLKLQSVSINQLDGTGGAGAAIRIEVRLDDQALELLTSRSRDAFRNAVRAYFGAVKLERAKLGDRSREDQTADAERNWGRFYDTMADRFAERARMYRQVIAAERQLPQMLSATRFAAPPVSVRFRQHADARKMLESAVLSSTSHDRATISASLFDAILDAAKSFQAPLRAEHATMFPLMALVPSANLEVRMGIGADSSSRPPFQLRKRFEKVGFESVTGFGRGPSVAPLGAGMFDIDAVVTEGL